MRIKDTLNTVEIKDHDTVSELKDQSSCYRRGLKIKDQSNPIVRGLLGQAASAAQEVLQRGRQSGESYRIPQ